MGIVGALLGLLVLAAFIVSLVCLIMVIVKMFQNDQSTLGIVTIILILCTGIGSLIAFVVGWMNAAKWNIRNLMLAWTGAIIGMMVLGALLFAMGVMTALDDIDNGFPQNNFEQPEFEAPDFEQPEF